MIPFSCPASEALVGCPSGAGGSERSSVWGERRIRGCSFASFPTNSERPQAPRVPSGAEALVHFCSVYGTTEVVPFQNICRVSGVSCSVLCQGAISVVPMKLHNRELCLEPRSSFAGFLQGLKPLPPSAASFLVASKSIALFRALRPD